MKTQSFVQAQAPMHAQAIAIFYRAFLTQDDSDVMVAGLLVQEYARMWYVMRASALVVFGRKPHVHVGTAGPFGGW